MIDKNFVFRLMAVFIIVLFLCLPVRANAQTTANRSARDMQFTSGQSALKIPFHITDGGHIFLHLRINNGSRPLWFGFDSGAEQTLISSKQAKALGLKLRGEMKATGGGEEEVDFSLTGNVSFELPGVKFVLKEVGVLPLEFPSPVAGESVGGLLGYDFISRFVVEVDYAARTINLYDPRKYRYRGNGQTVAVRMLDNNPHVSARVSLPGLAPIQAMFLIDSGADTNIFFYSPFVVKHKLLESSQLTTEAQVAGIGGTSKIRIGTATSIQLGRTVIENPVVHFSQAVKGDSASTVSAGFIGGKLLRQFKVVIFDQTRSRIILEPKTS
jgi:hypothetical protein